MKGESRKVSRAWRALLDEISWGPAEAVLTTMTDKDKPLDDGQEFKAFFCTACDREHAVFNPYVAQVEVFKECLKLGICPIAEDGIHGRLPRR